MTDAFLEQDLIPFESHSLVGKKVLVLAPHPDDETLGCGGSLIQHVRYGDPVKILFLTDGGAGYAPPNADNPTYISLREQESQQACAVLGIEDLTFLQFPDRKLGKESTHYDNIKAVISSYQPELIYATSPIDLNPDHRATANMVWRAIQELQLQTELVFYEISTPLPINVLVDISQEIELKTKAIKQYKSQMIQINYLAISLSMNRLRSLTIANHAQYAEGFVHFHSEEISENNINTFFNLKPLRIFKKKSPAPAISIIVRTNNRHIILREALKSLVDQTFKDFEVIIVNDGKIEVQSIVKEFKNSLRMQLKSTNGKGRSAAGNKGLTSAKGAFIGFLDDDDVLFPDHLQLLYNFLISKPDVSLAYSDCQLSHFEKDETGKIVQVGATQLLSGKDYEKDTLLKANYISIMTVLFRREMLELSGYMDTSMDQYEDWDLWIRMSEHGILRRVPVVTCQYRIFGDRDYNAFEAQWKVYQKYPHIYTPQKLTEWLHLSDIENQTLREKLEDFSNQKGESDLLSQFPKKA